LVLRIELIFVCYHYIIENGRTVVTQKFCCTYTKILLYLHKKFVVLPQKCKNDKN